MRKNKLMLAVASIAILAGGYWYLQPDPTEAVVVTPVKQSMQLSERPAFESSQANETVATVSVQQQSAGQEMSLEALAMFQKAVQQGWSSVVSDFEQGKVQNSAMSSKEKNKLCDLSLMNVSALDMQRLLQAGCRPTGKNVSNLMITPVLKAHYGKNYQQEIIAKLQLLHAQGLLQLTTQYNRQFQEQAQGEIQISLFDRAVSIGANEVLDYVISVGSQPSTQKSPIYTQVTGSVSEETVQKLLDLGYVPDQATLEYVQQPQFQQQHIKVYQLLDAQ